MKDAYKAMPNISITRLIKATLVASVGVFLSILVACGGGSTNSYYCSPNFVQGGIAMRVTHLVGSLNEYQFEVCYNDTFAGSQVSIYGVEIEADIATISTATDVRLAHMTDGLLPGDSFSVTFNNNDAWFVIYEDDSLGNLSTSSEVIRGEFR